jgi:hypothetical protein
MTQKNDEEALKELNNLIQDYMKGNRHLEVSYDGYHVKKSPVWLKDLMAERQRLLRRAQGGPRLISLVTSKGC